MTGVVVGGWEYVWTAYAITAGGLLVYGVSLINRLRNAGGGRVSGPADNV